MCTPQGKSWSTSSQLPGPCVLTRSAHCACLAGLPTTMHMHGRRPSAHAQLVIANGTPQSNVPLIIQAQSNQPQHHSSSFGASVRARESTDDGKFSYVPRTLAQQFVPSCTFCIYKYDVTVSSHSQHSFLCSRILLMTVAFTQ